MAVLSDRGAHLPLAALTWLFVVPVLSKVRQDPGLLAFLLEALQRPLEVLIVVDDEFRQSVASKDDTRE
jgi:hypothetical protein